MPLTITKRFPGTLITAVCTLLLISFGKASAQDNQQIVRIAKLQIDPPQLESYKALLKEGVETAVRVEPGVLTYYAVADKKNPAHITIFEVYANQDAYKAHLETPHFKKYKNGTLQMVKSLELIDVEPVVFATKDRE